VDVIRIGSEFEAWRRQTRLVADCLFLRLALLAAPARLRIFYLVFAAGRKQKPLPQWVMNVDLDSSDPRPL